jgi:formylglycine-generating enzyme required for sulfatase activity
MQKATVSAYRLDNFEITVGRLRAFVQAFDGKLRDNAPRVGAGAHPRVAKSGWRKSFDARLPGSMTEVNSRLTTACSRAGGTTAYGTSTWTEAPGANEDKPVTCIDWYTAFAFCAWDGGRLPTDAEWSKAALGGDEQRRYPWGNDDPFYETHKDVLVSWLPDRTENDVLKYTEGGPYRGATDGPLHIASVGKHTERGRYGHADLGGNVLEWVLDNAHFISGTCTDCADVEWPDPPQEPGQPPPSWAARDANGVLLGEDDFAAERAVHDGERFLRSSSFQGPEEGHPLLNNRNRHYYPVWRTYGAAGARCAR